ncbi:RRXRR domain-containing protein [Microvirga sp. CF3016]|uniref:RRXRR domain-containing protein n=1 Tax=Microvirga sp. CF3016 TaxID=3110181 RepID=UPI002E78F991|nr:RRXRR domain-containing protein [Microvirga sp. CF3016]MEE1609877.1 RRXRR domain-containing protein [Microvirga sp. CF3016]
MSWPVRIACHIKGQAVAGAGAPTSTRQPSTSRFIDRAAESRLQQSRLKTVPGSKEGGPAFVHVSEVRQMALALIELKHRGANIPDALTQRRAAI